MAFYFDAGGFVGALSGAALILLGLAVLGLKPRTRASVSFAAFAILWGAAVACVGASLMTDDVDTARTWIHAFTLLYLPLYVPLFYFALSYPWPTKGLARSAAVRAALFVPALGLVALFLSRPDLFIEGVGVDAAGLPFAIFGPLNTPIVTANTHLLVALAFGLLLAKLLKARGDAERAQLLLVVSALLLYLSHRAAKLGPQVAWDAADSWAEQGATEYALRLVMYASAAGAVVAALAAALARRDLPWRAWLTVAALLPLVVGLVELAIDSEDSSPYRSFGIWRLAAVATVAYGIARWRMFDLDLKLKWTLNRSVLGAVFLAAFFVVYEGSQTLLADQTGSAVVGVLGASLLVFALSPLQRFAERISHAALPHVQPSQQYVVYRKLQIYRAAYEEAANGGVTLKERALLERLRTELGIATEDAAALEQDVRQAFATGL